MRRGFLPVGFRSRWATRPTGGAVRATRTAVVRGQLVDAGVAKVVAPDAPRFASKREARRYQDLQLLVRAGAIADLECQVRIPLHAAGGARIGHYVADFRYRDTRTHALVLEDVKGGPRTASGAIGRTDLYLWKRRHVAAEYGWTITEV